MSTGPAGGGYQTSEDEQILHKLGYAQELFRAMGGFQNFAISFTIISILAGCLTSYFIAFNNGGPIAISWGWLWVGLMSTIISLAMAEIASAYPTAGGLYYWSAKLARRNAPAWSWFTGWFNLVGQVAITASIDFGLATVINFLISSYISDNLLTARWILFTYALVLILHGLINTFRVALVGLLNQISVWWHVAGVAVILAVLIFVPDNHASADFVFTDRINNSGFSDSMYWFYVLPLGFLLTQYTITGFDSCAHVSEETHGAADAAAKGVWRSIFYSAAIGWVLLLAITFLAAGPDQRDAAAGGSIPLLESALGSGSVKLILIISTVGQVFCGAACLTSASRMCYAFSRDGAIPGWRIWSKVNHNRVPVNAVLFMAVFAAVLTVPAFFGNAAGIPVAFFAVVSVAVIGLYIAYVIPIYLRWRMGDRFQTGPWTLGKKYKWMCLVSVIEVFLVVVIGFNLPFSSSGVPWESDFDWSLFNYTPVVTFGVFIAVGIWWLASARNWFTGPRRTIEEIDAEIGAPPPHPESP